MTLRNKALGLSALCFLYTLLYIALQWRWGGLSTFDYAVDSKITLEDVPNHDPNHDPSPPLTPDNSTLLAKESNEIDPEEKYLTFLTHSGIQNQLIQVENGILLAWYLNRTLILPRALLGDVFGWGQFGQLHFEHVLRDSTTDANCTGLENQLEYWEMTCPDREQYATIPFDELFNLEWAKQHVKILSRERTDFEWLEDRFGIQRAGLLDHDESEYVDGDILFFKGNKRYDYRIFDTPRARRWLGKYDIGLDIYQLRQRSERLMHFSSLFGTGRLPIRQPEHYEFMNTLHHSVTYRHPLVLSLAEYIVSQLESEGFFIGLHVRSGDGRFIEALPENIANIIDHIERAIELKNGPSTHKIEIPDNPSLDQCKILALSSKVPLIYMATDARAPRSIPALAPLWKHYPCTFIMEDILPPSDQRWEGFSTLKDNRSGNNMRKFLPPLVDAAVASRGWKFIGSKGSTFSSYISRLHRVHWSMDENKKS